MVVGGEIVGGVVVGGVIVGGVTVAGTGGGCGVVVLGGGVVANGRPTVCDVSVRAE